MDDHGPHAIIDHPDVRRTLAVMKAKIEAAPRHLLPRRGRGRSGRAYG
jgi:alkylation response protein AidB-like acyl-CoA dehydrogenase